jgi:hypothetical protein
MAVAILMEFPGSTAEDYNRVMQQLGEDFTPPEGAISHVSVAMEDALRVLDVWETREQFDEFYGSRLRRAFDAAGVEATEPKYREAVNVMAVEHLPTPAA